MIVVSTMARQLRKRMTPQEIKLWVHLRGLRPHGFHFRRQAPIGPYIVDFVCFKMNLIIEADGGQHARAVEAACDATRDAALITHGFQILRFWNSDIDRNLSGVMETIHARLTAPTRPGKSRSTLPTARSKGFAWGRD